MSTVQRDGVWKRIWNNLSQCWGSQWSEEWAQRLLKEKKGKMRKIFAISDPFFSGYRGGGVGEGRVGRKMNVHLCELWPDFGNESRFCHVSVDWQSLQENGVQQVKGIPKSLRDNAQQSHRSLQQQTAWLKGWELEGIPNKTAFPFPKLLIYWDHRILMSYQPSRNEGR